MIVFNDVPELGQEKATRPFVNKPRRLAYKKPSRRHRSARKPRKPAFRENWDAVLLALPKDQMGGIDWSRALAEAVIKPKAGIDAKAAEQPVLPLDVHFEPAKLPMFKATFPHQQHTQWLACANCHPKPFAMRAGADPITMEKIFSGQYCGKCHGKVAFEVTTGCPRCHQALAGAR